MLKLFKLKLPFLILTVCLGVFGYFNYAYAVWDFVEESALSVVGVLVQLVIMALGMIISAVIWAVIHVANYNNFINEPPIVDAWIIIRDFGNMLFILVLLLVAFSTILRVESYNAKKILPKLLIMAVLINFSRTICGLIIDFAQIIMLTFINAIGSSGGNFVNTLGVQNYLDMAKNQNWEGEINLMSTVGGLILGVVFLVISVVVMVAFLAVITMRIVMLWIYVVLSPLAFLLSAFPAGKKYADQWWSEFVNYVISGPILAFFLWLALIASSQSKSISISSGKCFGPASILCPESFVNFIVAIGMLMGGLMITSKLGGYVSKAASTGEKWAKTSLKTGSDYLNKKQGAYTGFDFNAKRQMDRIKTGFAEMDKKDMRAMQLKSTENLRHGGIRGMVTGFTATDWTENYLQGFLGKKLITKGVMGGWSGQKRVQGALREQSDSLHLMNNVATEPEYNKKKKDILNQIIDARSKGNIPKVRELQNELKFLTDNRENLVMNTDEDVAAKKDYYKSMADKASLRAAKLKISDFRGVGESPPKIGMNLTTTGQINFLIKYFFI